MGNSLRCCLACVLPCGALDLIRIVHLNGDVEEITGPITAGEILDANPNHILSKPCAQGVVRRIMILSPESELKRGSIYFLIPNTSLPPPPPESKKLGGARASDSSEMISDDVVVYQKKSQRRSRRKCNQVMSGAWNPYLQSISEE